jgi:Flp pilus assembly protein TadD
MKIRKILLGTAAPLMTALVLGGCSITSDQGGATATATADAEAVQPPATPEDVAEPTAEESAATLMRMGDFTMARGDATSALTLYRRAHEAAPDEAEPLIRLGSALARVGSYEEAAGAFRTALDIEAANPEAVRGLANAEIALNRPQRALPVLEAAIARPGADALMHNTYGVALDHLGRHAEAQDHYRKGLQAVPNDLDMQTNLAISLALTGQYAEAVDTMRQVATAPSASAKHRQNLALVLGLAGRRAEAAEVARIDADDTTVAANLDFFDDLRAISNSGERAVAIGEGSL